jgi:hypothetical protein
MIEHHQMSADRWLRFRRRGNLLVPFEELPMPESAVKPTEKLPIERVRLGPLAGAAVEKESVDLFLLARGYAKAESIGSEIPLR